jgi:hypothetical protein
MFVCADVTFFVPYLLMLSVSRLYTIDGRMTAELERILKEAVEASWYLFVRTDENHEKL